MLIIGFTGTVDRIDTNNFAFGGIGHDSAAVILRDGRLIAAVEQERFDRIKHSNKAPLEAIQFCLNEAAATISDVDCFSFYLDEAFLGQPQPALFLAPGRALNRSSFQKLLEQAFGYKVPPERFMFVRHHIAHAASAFAASNFPRSLVVSLDAMGDYESGAIFTADSAELRCLRSLSAKQALGQFYLNVIHHMGFRIFEEYKVMGLAPYGDPARYSNLFRKLYALEPEGHYTINFQNMVETLTSDVGKLSAPSLRIEQAHKDLAAGLQFALEEIVFHILTHFRTATGLPELCLAGGVTHNCSLNGKLLASRLFEQIYVQPAAHDAGAALGAAVIAHSSLTNASLTCEMPHVYLGPHVGTDSVIEQQLRRWTNLIDVERLEDVSSRTAALLAKGLVIGWVQGRVEFGPRALGNRSILADPRAASNKERINAMVKKREAFRPFAPSVTEDDATQYFETFNTPSLPFMTFVVKVRPEYQSLLGAITHVDGTARVQTVSQRSNPLFWELLRNFGALTGFPILLNTSFNNNVEPIVNSVDEAVTCFVTTDLDCLIVGNYLVQRKPGIGTHSYHSFRLRLARYAVMNEEVRTPSQPLDSIEPYLFVRSLHAPQTQNRVELSAAMYRLLSAADRETPLGQLFDQIRDSDFNEDNLVSEILDLWQRRLISLRPIGIQN